MFPYRNMAGYSTDKNYDERFQPQKKTTSVLMGISKSRSSSRTHRIWEQNWTWTNWE